MFYFFIRLDSLGKSICLLRFCYMFHSSFIRIVLNVRPTLFLFCGWFRFLCPVEKHTNFNKCRLIYILSFSRVWFILVFPFAHKQVENVIFRLVVASYQLFILLAVVCRHFVILVWIVLFRLNEISLILSVHEGSNVCLGLLLIKKRLIVFFKVYFLTYWFVFFLIFFSHLIILRMLYFFISGAFISFISLFIAVVE